ncbi:unnamed protein product [Ectocarpus fasciculatus]
MGQGSSTHPIHRAGRSGDLCVVRRFLRKPAILNRRDIDEMTCLHWASQLGQIDVIQELIAADAIELNAQDGNGWTPLMHACARGHRSVVGALLTAGASVDIESHDGRTALHRAATWKRLGPLDQLIEAGADVRHGARNKWTPLHCAAAAGDAHACSILVGAGADVDAQDIFGLKAADVVADFTTTDLVKRALTQAPQGTPPRSSRALSTRLSSTPSSGSNGAAAAAAATPTVAAATAAAAAVAAGAGTTICKLPIESLGGRVDLLSSATATAGDGATTGVDVKRGSWSRPVGPRPLPGGTNRSGGGSDSLRSCGSVKPSSAPRRLSRHQVAVVGLEAHMGPELLGNGGEVGVSGHERSGAGEPGIEDKSSPRDENVIVS